MSKNPRILCLMAGSCIEGLVLAEHYSGEVTCLDLQKSSLAKGLKEAKRKRLKLRTIAGDINDIPKHTKGRYNLVTVVGSPLPPVVNIHLRHNPRDGSFNGCISDALVTAGSKCTCGRLGYSSTCSSRTDIQRSTSHPI